MIFFFENVTDSTDSFRFLPPLTEFENGRVHLPLVALRAEPQPDMEDRSPRRGGGGSKVGRCSITLLWS